MTVYRRPDPIPLRSLPQPEGQGRISAIRGDVEDLNRQVARRIFHAILDGKFAPGTLLPNEHDLSADLGVSRTSLREAIKGLSSKGLVETRRKRGTLVLERRHWSMLDADIVSWSRRSGSTGVSRELWDAVRLVQPGLAAEAAKRRNPGKLGKIAGALGEAVAPAERLGFFVDTLIEVAHLSGNRFLYSLMATAIDNLRQEDEASLLGHGAALTEADIGTLYRDIAAGNIVGAERTMARIVGETVPETA